MTGSEATRPTLIRAGSVFDGASDTTLGALEILIREGVIAEIGSSLDAPLDVDIVHAENHTISPGFIDCHVHTQLTPDRLLGNYQLESSAMKALLAIPVLDEIVRSGFTTVRDAASLDEDFGTVALKRAVELGVIDGPRMLVCPHMFSGTGGHGETCVLDPAFHRPGPGIADGVDEIRKKVRHEIFGGADWIKVSLSGFLGSRGGDGPVDMSWSELELTTAVETARDFGVDVCVHALGDESVQRAIRSGARSVEHACLASDEALALAAASGTFIVPTMHMVSLFLNGSVVDVSGGPAGVDAAARPGFGLFALDAELADGQRRLAQSDVQLAFGSDSGGFPHADAWREFEAMVRAGVSPARALRAATTVAASLLRRPDLGRIAVGATADVIAMRGNPLEDITATGRVDFVMKEGRQLVGDTLRERPS